jgi:hypothetical protein
MSHVNYQYPTAVFTMKRARICLLSQYSHEIAMCVMYAYSQAYWNVVEIESCSLTRFLYVKLLAPMDIPRQFVHRAHVKPRKKMRLAAGPMLTSRGPGGPTRPLRTTVCRCIYKRRRTP